MAKLKLIADPTFQVKVSIPIAGSDPAEVLMTFKHRTRKQWDEWIASHTDETRTNADACMELVVGWDLTDEFNRANVELLLDNHYTAGIAIASAYANALWDNKVKN